MTSTEISDEIQKFIFEYIDSVEQLEVLLLLHGERHRYFTAKEISQTLRSNESAVNLRLNQIQNISLLTTTTDSPPKYQFKSSQESDLLFEKLAEEYQIRPGKIQQLIYSPLKRARHFSDAFSITKSPKKRGDDNG